MSQGTFPHFFLSQGAGWHNAWVSHYAILNYAITLWRDQKFWLANTDTETFFGPIFWANTLKNPYMISKRLKIKTSHSVYYVLCAVLALYAPVSGHCVTAEKNWNHKQFVQGEI